MDVLPPVTPQTATLSGSEVLKTATAIHQNEEYICNESYDERWAGCKHTIKLRSRAKFELTNNTFALGGAINPMSPVSRKI